IRDRNVTGVQTCALPISLINEKYQPFINKRLLISVRFLQAYYGNERSNTQNQLYNTQQIVLDMVSQCWLLRYRQAKNKLAINDEIGRASCRERGQLRVVT